MDKLDTVRHDSALSLEVVAYKLQSLAESIDDIKRSMTHMATKEQVAALVSRSEFERQSWELAAHKEHTDREIRTLRDEIERNSVRKLWATITTLASGAAGIVALVMQFLPGKT